MRWSDIIKVSKSQLIPKNNFLSSFATITLHLLGSVDQQLPIQTTTSTATSVYQLLCNEIFIAVKLCTYFSAEKNQAILQCPEFPKENCWILKLC